MGSINKDSIFRYINYQKIQEDKTRKYVVYENLGADISGCLIL